MMIPQLIWVLFMVYVFGIQYTNRRNDKDRFLSFIMGFVFMNLLLLFGGFFNGFIE